MAENRDPGACGGFFGNDVILWFIIVFLLLFWGWGGYGFGGYGAVV